MQKEPTTRNVELQVSEASEKPATPGDNVQMSFVAYHEAGHAVAYWLTDRMFEYVTIEPDPERVSLGHIKDHPEQESRMPREGYINVDELIRNLAGHEAEKIYTGKSDDEGAMGDYRHASDQILGLDWAPSPYCDFLSIEMFRVGSGLAELLLREKWKAVEAVAAALLEKTKLEYNDAIRVIDRATLSPEEFKELEEWKAKIIKDSRESPLPESPPPTKAGILRKKVIDLIHTEVQEEQSLTEKEAMSGLVSAAVWILLGYGGAELAIDTLEKAKKACEKSQVKQEGEGLNCS